MGQLLAGVAHELNNPLAVVRGQAALLRGMVEGGPLAPRAQKIAQAAERCARIVRNFLVLARQQPPERQQVQLNQIVQEAVELLAYQLRVDNVEVRLDLAEDLPVLWADPHQLLQVVINLVSNAHQAMRQTPLPRQLSLTLQCDPERARVRLKVTNTGPGIAPEIQARIFEPFFTTKPVGVGTGLGLSLCQGIVESHAGSIWAESPPGQGAVFVVELPVEVAPVTAAEAKAADAPPPLRGKAVLVVDDEPEIAATLAEMLAADDHHVEMAANGVIALDRLRERTYDVILSDLRMPELDGPGLYRELERRQPELLGRLIFVTGDTLAPETRAFVARTGALTVSKPFAPEEIRKAIQQAMRRPSQGRP
jgi:two-component system NtrC family sensor kinase